MKTMTPKAALLSVLLCLVGGKACGVSADNNSSSTALPVTNFFFDGFENLSQSLDCWTVSSGMWEIGVPTSGPAPNALGRRAFGGTNCAATVLGGNYPANTSSRLESCSFVVPATNQNPRLRFWHWFSTPYGSHNGRVQIKVGNGNWQDVSPTYYYSSGVWTRPSIDLAPWAGRTVQIGFQFQADGGTTAAGWYVDEVAVVIGPVASSNPEDFELGLSDWSAERGGWQVGIPSGGPGVAHSGTNCAGTVLEGNYANYISSRLISPSFVVPGTNQNPRLRFWHWFSTPYGSHNGRVQIKAVNGTWADASPAYSYSGGAWTSPLIDLTPWAGQAVQIAFLFEADNGVVSSGWYVDDVMVVTGPIVLNNPENFEVGLGDWSAERGLWQAGVPTSGPGTAHNGTNCVGTVLSGNYPNFASSRLISPPLVVPSANSNPRLRFWHWFSTPYGSHGGRVQVKAGNGGWQDASPVYYYSGGGWTRPSIDLTPWAGQTVQIAFLFEADNGVVSSGWYVDEVTLVTGPIILNNPDDLELGLGDWSAERGLWQVGMPTSGPGAAHNGTNCAATILGGNYPNYGASRLVSPPFMVPPAAANPRLRFWHWFNTPYGSHNGRVQIKAGNGNWTDASSDVYAGASGAWTRPSVDLSRWGGQTVQIAFFFQADNGVVSSGWYIDEVRLLHDLALVMLDSPILRTQTVACVSVGVGASLPASTVTYTLQAPPGHLGNVTLHTAGCWTGSLAPQSDSQWLISLRNNCTNAAMGVQTVGSICFTAISTESAFVPLSLTDLAVANLDGSTPPALPFGSRPVIIADQPLLEAWLGPNRQRMATTYGKADTAYEISQAIDLNTAMPWTSAWTNIVPASLSFTSPVQGSLSNAPALYLRATER